MQKIKEITLNKQKLEMQVALTKELLEDCSVELIEDYYTERLLLKLKASVYTGPSKVVKLPKPSSWFEHFKLEVLPNWILKKYPVKYDTINIDVSAAFPELKDCPGLGDPQIKINMYENLGYKDSLVD